MLAALCLLVSSCFAADTFYLGAWKIESAAVAPWWTQRNRPDPAETKTLIGKIFVINVKSISGPPPLACPYARYKVADYPANMLFQGAFDEMHAHDPSADPGKLAASAGFRGSRWKTLETGCAAGIDFHFLDPGTLAFGLNDYIYKAKKQR